MKVIEFFEGISLIKIEQQILQIIFYWIQWRPQPLGALRQLPRLASRSYTTEDPYGMVPLKSYFIWATQSIDLFICGSD